MIACQEATGMTGGCFSRPRVVTLRQLRRRADMYICPLIHVCTRQYLLATVGMIVLALPADLMIAVAELLRRE